MEEGRRVVEVPEKVIYGGVFTHPSKIGPVATPTERLP